MLVKSYEDGKETTFRAPVILAYTASRIIDRTAPDGADKPSEIELNMVKNAAHAILSARALKLKGIDCPKEITYKTAYDFTLEYYVELSLDGNADQSGDVDENPTDTPRENS